ncbi:MAG TPA: hypothetical protein VMR45_03635 [Patescibacteria group bacterium]|nr:hypothetical protein [Patescibacteria group bacterium]
MRNTASDEDDNNDYNVAYANVHKYHLVYTCQLGRVKQNAKS